MQKMQRSINNKLKAVFNKCQSLHFLCKSCDSHINSPLESNDHLEKQEVITTIKTFLSEGISQLETKIESTILEKINEKISNLHSSVKPATY